MIVSILPMKKVLELTVSSFPWLACAILLGGCDLAKETGEEKAKESSSEAVPAPQVNSPSPQVSAHPVDTEPSCAAICDKSKSKGCAGELSVCMARCRDMTLEAECRSELARALACLAGLSDADFECGDEGFPEVLPGRCDREQEVVVRCLSATLR